MNNNNGYDVYAFNDAIVQQFEIHAENTILAEFTFCDNADETPLHFLCYLFSSECEKLNPGQQCAKPKGFKIDWKDRVL